jgi:predicted Rossmann-fold nucleotide-binding protein
VREGEGWLTMLHQIVTWNQIGIHDKPVVVFNVEGYWDGLLQWVRKATSTGFVAKGNENIMVEAHTAEEVVLKLQNYQIAKTRLDLNWED